MFCKHCGRPISEDDTFCAACGAPVSEKTETETPAATAEETPAAIAEETPVAPAQETPAPAPKKKSPLKWILACVAVALVATVAVVACNFSAVKRLFQPDEVYLRGVLLDAAKDASHSTAVYLDTLKESAAGTGGDCLIEVQLGDRAKELLDADWADTLSVDGEVIWKNGLSEAFTLSLNGQEIVDCNLILDTENGDMYMQIPTMSERYLYAPLSELGADPGAFDVLAVYDALPSGAMYEKIVNRYAEMLLAGVEEVESARDTLEAAGVAQKCTVYTLTVDEDTVGEVLPDILDEMRRDEDIEEVLYTFIDSIGAMYGLNADAVYSAFRDGLEALAAECEEALPEMRMDINVYVASSGEIIGADFTVDEVTLSWYATEDGTRRGSEIALTNGTEKLFSFGGKGEVEKNLYSGKLTLTVSGMAILNIEADDWNVKNAAEGKYQGKLTLSLTEAAKSMIAMGTNGSASVAPSLVSEFSGYEIVLDMRMNRNEGEMLLKLTDGDELFASIRAESSVSARQKEISMPKAEDAVSALSETQVQEWVLGLDFSALVGNLRKAGVPEDLLEGLIWMANMNGIAVSE